MSSFYGTFADAILNNKDKDLQSTSYIILKKLRNISINNEILNNNEILHNKILTYYNLTHSIVYPSIREEPVVLYR